MSTSKRVVKVLIADLNARRGLGDEWDQLDDGMKTEITADWEDFVFGILTEYDAPYLGQN